MQDITAKKSKSLMADAKPGTLIVLDVRQEWEYEKFHLPGASWIPLPELPDRLEEVAGDVPILVYCRSGGRSKAGAMLLDSAGHKKVYSMTGGMMAWNGSIAIGAIDSGLDSLLSARSKRDALLTSYGMETFLQAFYLRLHDEATDADAKGMYKRLAGFEDGHRNSIYERYTRAEESPLERDNFEAAANLVAAEGGVDPDQFIADHDAVLKSVADIVGMAMMFEAQAFDFYLRASRKFENEDMRKLMLGLAKEEQAHLKVLASFMDKQA